MSDKSILQLSAVADLTGDEQVPVVQGGATKRASVSQWAAALATYFPPYTATINGINSVNGGGTIGTNITIELVNDLASPGAGMVYGTDGAGVRGWQAAVGGGTVLQVDTGVGLTGGPITASGTIDLANTAVVAGAYGSATESVSLQVDAQGRLISANSVTVTPAWASITGTPTTLVGYGITDAVPATRTVTAGAGMSGGGALSGDITLAIADIVAAAGPIGDGATVPVITINAKGQVTALTTAAITAASTGGIADPGANGVVVRTSAGVSTARTITGGTNISVADGDGVAGNPTVGITGQIALANGGTNANLTASNGGIIYSDASGMAVLSGTATAGQIVRSGSNAAPSWSTATFPATTTINELLYSSAGNVVSGLATVSAAVLTTAAGVPTWATLLSGALGGTNNGFMQFSGPTTATKTFTLPDSSQTIACLGEVQSFSVAQRGAVTALADGATITPDFAAANNFSLTIGGNRTLANPTNQTAGQSGSIVITQDGTGGRTLAFGSNWKFPGGTAPSLSSAAGDVDTLVYYVESASRITAQLLKNVS